MCVCVCVCVCVRVYVRVCVRVCACVCEGLTCDAGEDERSDFEAEPRARDEADPQQDGDEPAHHSRHLQHLQPQQVVCREKGQGVMTRTNRGTQGARPAMQPGDPGVQPQERYVTRVHNA